MINNILNLFHPSRFQGKGKKHAYFEGWYFKFVDKTETKAMAVISGISLAEAGQSHAFIQILDGKRSVSHYHRFPLEQFRSSKNKFEISIGENRFSEDNISLNLPDTSGEINFESLTPWPRHWYSPGAMGPFSFLPFMECRHGIISLDHPTRGHLVISGEKIDFNQGRGYMEKDWGRSFPEAYIWLQSNHFNQPGTSLTVSVARIPWLKKKFTGFIVGLRDDGRLYEFTSYNRSGLKLLKIEETKADLEFENSKYLLSISVSRTFPTDLASPVMGKMAGRIGESMTSNVEVILRDKKAGQIIFQGPGRNTALEVAGKTGELIGA